jgi:hypothetical protein
VKVIFGMLVKFNGGAVNLYVYFGFIFFGSLTENIVYLQEINVLFRNYSLNRLLSDAFNIVLAFCLEALLSRVLTLSFFW